MATDTAVKPEPKTDGKTDAKPKAKKTPDRAKFREIAGARLGASIASITLLGKLANPTAYQYNEADITFIRSHLTEAVDTTCKRLSNALNSGKAAPKQTTLELPE